MRNVTSYFCILVLLSFCQQSRAVPSLYKLIMMFPELACWVDFCALYHTGHGLDEPSVVFGDIAVATGLEIADPCTARGCKWQRSKSGKVLVPYVISNEYCEWQLLAHSKPCTTTLLFRPFFISELSNSLPREGCHFSRLEIFWGIDLHSLHASKKSEGLYQHRV